MSWVVLMVCMAVFMSFNFSGRGRRRFSRQEEQRLAALEAELASRDDSILALEGRVAELESRLDFAERLLSTPSDGRSLSDGRSAVG
jgi:hypothetical protein